MCNACTFEWGIHLLLILRVNLNFVRNRSLRQYLIDDETMTSYVSKDLVYGCDAADETQSHLYLFDDGNWKAIYEFNLFIWHPNRQNDRKTCTAHTFIIAFFMKERKLYINVKHLHLFNIDESKKRYIINTMTKLQTDSFYHDSNFSLNWQYSVQYQVISVDHHRCCRIGCHVIHDVAFEWDPLSVSAQSYRPHHLVICTQFQTKQRSRENETNKQTKATKIRLMKMCIINTLNKAIRGKFSRQKIGCTQIKSTNLYNQQQ